MSREWKQKWILRVITRERATRRLLVLAFVPLSLCVAIFVVRAYHKENMLPGGAGETANTTPLTVAPMEAPKLTVAQGEVLQVKLVTLTPRGFDPPELISSKSKFVLDVENITGLSEISLIFEKASQEPVQTKQLSRGKVGWARAYDLEPGIYVLKEANHPDWRCTITVTAE